MPSGLTSPTPFQKLICAYLAANGAPASPDAPGGGPGGGARVRAAFPHCAFPPAVP